MTQYFTVAGITWRVLSPPGTAPFRGGCLADFEITAPSGWDHTLDVQISSTLPCPQGRLVYQDPGKQIYAQEDLHMRYTGTVEKDPCQGNLYIARRADRSTVIFRPEQQPGYITEKVILNAMEAEHQIVQRDGFLLHASWICHNGRAILFTAPSGTGKSTQAALWQQLRGAELINGDRAAVFAEADQWPQVRGSPFAGSSGVGKNRQMPLAALVYLSQAPETTITSLGGYRAFRNIWEGCCVNLWDREDVDRCAGTVARVLERVPVFHLACRPDESAVLALERRLEEL